MQLNDFDKFVSRTVIEGKLVTKTQLHIGSGERGDVIDQLFIKVRINDRDVPYIPGSSLKGVFRSLIEQIFGIDGEVVNYIFGKAGERTEDSCAAHMKVMDCLLDLKDETIPLIKKTGIAIDRRTGSVARGALFSMEVLPPELKFDFKVILENINLEDTNSSVVKAILYLINDLKEGNISIGGKTTSGLGNVKLEDIRVKTLTIDDIKAGNYQYRPIELFST